MDEKQILNPDRETKSLVEEDSDDFSKFTVLGFLHNLISECASSLEDCGDLLKDCYDDREGLLELECPISSTMLNWCYQNKALNTLEMLIAFCNNLAKMGKISSGLRFLLTLRKDFSFVFRTGHASFADLENAYERVKAFEQSLSANLPLFNDEIDTLIVWLEENHAILKKADNILLVDEPEKEDYNSKSTTKCIVHLQEFCNDLKTRFIKCMLVQIDEQAKKEGLCPLYDSNHSTRDRGLLLLEHYAQKPELKQKIDYLNNILGVEFIERLGTLDQSFQHVVHLANSIDKSLGTVKRIAYLNQGLDPRTLFSFGFCAGDGMAWCQNMFNEYFHNLPNQVGHPLISRQSLHPESIAENTYQLQMKHGFSIIYRDLLSSSSYSLSESVTDLASAQLLCVKIFDAINQISMQNNTIMSFAVELSNKDPHCGHQISFCRFFRNGETVFRVRDLNCGEFEGSFSELKAWYPLIYSACYGISSSWLSSPYDNVSIRTIMIPTKQKLSLHSDAQCRLLIGKYFSISTQYSLFSNNSLEKILQIHHSISAPTTRDNIIYFVMLYNSYNEHLFSNPKQVAIHFEYILNQLLNFKSAEYRVFQKHIQIAQLIAFYNDGQLNTFRKCCLKIFSSITPESIEYEDNVIIKFAIVQLKNWLLPLADESKKIAIAKDYALEITQFLDITRISLESLQKSIKTDLSNAQLFKKTIALFELSQRKIAFLVPDENFFNDMIQFKHTGSQEEPLPLSIEQAMDRFLKALNDKKNVFISQSNILFLPQTTPMSLTSGTLTNQQSQQNLMFMYQAKAERAWKDEQNWKKWEKRYNQKHPGAKNYGYGPGALVPYDILK